MKIRFYENPQRTIRISLDGSDNPLYTGRGADSAFVDVGEEENEIPFYVPIEYVRDVPMGDSNVREFLEELRRFNPLLLREIDKITGSETNLIDALRETKKSLDKEVALEKRMEEKVGKIRVL